MKGNPPLVTVLIPAYRSEAFIARCIRSLVNQSLPAADFEIVVVDDGSDDGTLEEVEKFGEKLVVIQNHQNQGLPAALNLGISEARGKYLVRVDSDDYVGRDFLLGLLIEVRKGLFDAVACDYWVFDDAGGWWGVENCFEKPIGCGIMFKLDHVLQAGMFDERFLLHEDRDFRLRFEKLFTIGRLETALYRYRRHGTNLTQRKELDGKFRSLYSKVHNVNPDWTSPWLQL